MKNQNTENNKKGARRWRRIAAGVLAAACMLTAGAAVQAEESVLPGGKQMYNLLLIGTDHRDDSWNGNSDVMMVASINAKTERITLVSFMRDLRADIPGHGVHKLNYAYAAGGADTLEQTLEQTYDLPIDNYAVVDFESMAGIVDAVGGVEMTVSEAECTWVNNYLRSMQAEEDFLPCGGTYVLNGNQAVAYMRIRYVGNNDYERTQRQRDVLKQIFDSVHEMDANGLAVLTEEVLPEVEHNIGTLQMLQVMAALPQVAGYELAESRIPYDGLFYSESEMLVPDVAQTTQRLHEELGM